MKLEQNQKDFINQVKNRKSEKLTSDIVLNRFINSMKDIDALLLANDLTEGEGLQPLFKDLKDWNTEDLDKLQSILLWALNRRGLYVSK